MLYGAKSWLRLIAHICVDPVIPEQHDTWQAKMATPFLQALRVVSGA